MEDYRVSSASMSVICRFGVEIAKANDCVPGNTRVLRPEFNGKIPAGLAGDFKTSDYAVLQ